MFKKIFNIIKKYDDIVIARHIGPDPDAMASQLALRDAIRLTFPQKRVYAIGSGTTKFTYLGRLDKTPEGSNFLLILLDTPDKKRIDGVDFSKISYTVKMDHHPFMEQIGDLEYIEETASSTCEIIMDFLKNTKLKCDEEIAKKLYIGLVSDSNRFKNGSTSPKTFRLSADYVEEYNLNLPALYEEMYLRPLKEVRLQGYIGENMIVTDNGVGYIKVTNDIINKFQVDSAAAGNIVNEFNHISEVLVWATITEDLKNDIIRISIRSRGPEINTIAERYNGGGHKFASGARVHSFEEAMCLMEELDQACERFIKNESL